MPLCSDFADELKSLDIDPETFSLLVEYTRLKRQLVVINARLDNVKQLMLVKDIK